MSASGGKTRKGKAGKRRWIVPAVGKDPMLWKELFIERVGSIGVAGQILGAMLVCYLIAASMYVMFEYIQGFRLKDDSYLRHAEVYGRDLLANSSRFVNVLIVAAIGLRASVTIAAERERGSWDAILTSPLEGVEIVRGKLWGSLIALRWLILAAFGSWVVACFVGATSVRDCVFLIAETLLIGAFAATFGVYASLKYSTATRAMSATIIILFVVHLGIMALSGVIVLACGLVLWAIFVQFGISSNNLPSFSTPWHIVLMSLYASFTLILISSAALRFDRLAGRMTGGELAGAVDRFFHGVPIDEPFEVVESK